METYIFNLRFNFQKEEALINKRAKCLKKYYLLIKNNRILRKEKLNKYIYKTLMIVV